MTLEENVAVTQFSRVDILSIDITKASYKHGYSANSALYICAFAFYKISVFDCFTVKNNIIEF